MCECVSASVFVFFFREHHRIHKHPDVARCPRKFKKPGSIIAVKTNAGFTRPANEGLSMSTLDFFFFCHCFSFLALCFHKEKKKKLLFISVVEWKSSNFPIFPFSCLHALRLITCKSLLGCFFLFLFFLDVRQVSQWEIGKIFWLSIKITHSPRGI